MDTVINMASSASAIIQTSFVANFLIMLALSSVLSQMMTMVNALQIFIDAFPLMNVSVPGNVTLMLTQMQSISSFNLLPANTIFELMFKFSEASVTGIGFAAMGVTSARLILNLNSFFFYYIIFGIVILLYFVLRLYKDRHSAIPRLMKKIESSILWSGFIRLVV